MWGWGGDEDNYNMHGNGDVLGTACKNCAGMGWGWGLRHTVKGGNGVKSLSPCHSLV